MPTKNTLPNILLVMVDDMGFSDIGCYGSEILTPNIDRLAENGLRFSQFYNASRCCPTRASLLTGLYPHQAGVGRMVNARPDEIPGPYQGFLNEQCVTIAEVLRSAGYSTMMSGKWHVGEDRPHWPTDRGFDTYFGLISGAANYFDISKGKNANVIRQMAKDDQPWSPPETGFYMTDAITDNAIEQLDRFGDSGKPVFQYITYTAPHWPLHALPQDIEKYRGKYTEGWQSLREQRYKRLVDMGFIKSDWQLSPQDPRAAEWQTLTDEQRDLVDLKMAIYAAQLDRVDQGIGRIIKKLKELGRFDNTLLLFLSDNGACHESGALGFDLRENGLPPGGVDSYMSYGLSWSNAGNTPFRMHKHWVHEGGISTPLIAHWPGKIKGVGKISHQVGHIVDIMATCCDAAGIDYPETYKGRPVQPLVGKSLLPVFQSGLREGHETVYWEHIGSKAVRQGKWKLVAANGGDWELYDMETDRTELNDLSQSQPEIYRDLIAKYETWAHENGVKPVN